MPQPDAAPLAVDELTRLTDFARACKAAARIVALYPATHPAIQASLARVAESGRRLSAGGAATLTVLPDAVLLAGRASPKPDGVLSELAALLHAHLIGELTIIGDMPAATWHTFLSLLARTPDDLRKSGGISRAWMAAGGGPIEVRQIDYAEVLRERKGDLASEWDDIVANYLEGELSDLDDEAMAALFDLTRDTSRFKEFAERLIAQAAEDGPRGKKDVVLKVLQALADFVARLHPDQLDRVLHQIASVVPRLTPDHMIRLLAMAAGDEGATGIDLPGEVRARLSDRSIAEFVAQSVARDNGATARLAQAFQALVPDESQRAQILAVAEQQAEELPLGRQADFADLWKKAAELLTSYTDSDWVSDEYGRQLGMVRAAAVEIERITDDPSERINRWLSTVSEQEVSCLDQRVLLDLLAIESRPDAWRRVLDVSVSSIEHLALTGNIPLAHPLLDSITTASRNGAPFVEAARAGLERLKNGSLMKHVVLAIRQARDDEVPAIAAFCRTLGPTVIGALAEALVSEHGSAVKRLRDVLLSFGAAGRGYVDELRKSANPTVRKTAVELLRAFGGAEALPDLKALLRDTEPAIQRDALRAIVHIGTNEAYATVGDAIQSGDLQTRDAIMHILSASHDERAAPLFVYILEHTNPRGELEGVYTLAIEGLAQVGGDAESVAALTRVLHRGHWWAPWRTARLRSAAATALRACGSMLSHAALEEAARNGPAGVRKAAKAALSGPAPRTPPRRSS